MTSQAPSRLAAARGWRVYKPTRSLGFSSSITEQRYNIQGNPGDKLKTNHVCLFLLHKTAAAELLKLPPTANKTPNCDTMKVAVVFVLLFATVLCRPARKVSESSESSEEVVRRPAAQPLRRKAAETPQYRAAPVQNVVAAAAGSDVSSESSDEDEQAAVELTSDATASPDSASVDSQDSEDSDDDDDDEAEENDTDEDDTSESSESGESSSPAPATLTPVIVTEEPVAEATAEPIEPTIVTDTETARGDSLGGYPSDYKSIIYVEEKTYHKVPAPYKSYEYMGTGKKVAYDMTEGNEVDKSLKVYKVQALQVHNDILEEDTSTPDVESQGLDASSGTSQDQDTRQASLPEEEESASTSDANTSESSSSSAPEEEEEDDESASTASNSTSQESEDEDSQSSEEATATPGAVDSESDESPESDSDEQVVVPDATTDMPAVITAK